MRILVVDDVWDTGRTIVAVKQRIEAAGGHADLAVLHYKPSHSKFDERPDLVGFNCLGAEVESFCNFLVRVSNRYESQRLLLAVAKYRISIAQVGLEQLAESEKQFLPVL